MVKYRMSYLKFRNINEEGWEISSNGTMGTYSNMEEMQKDLKAEISCFTDFFKNVKVKMDCNECIVTYDNKSWEGNKIENVIIYKFLEFDLDKILEENK